MHSSYATEFSQMVCKYIRPRNVELDAVCSKKHVATFLAQANPSLQVKPGLKIGKVHSVKY